MSPILVAVRFWISGMTPPPTTIVMNSPEAVAVYFPSPSVARLKITPHMTEVQIPQRMMNSTFTGTSA